MAPLWQVAVMGAIVATLAYFPAGLALALAFGLFEVSFEKFVRFGGAFNIFFGLVVWWLLAFAGACVYAAFVYPWGEKVIAWPRKR